MTQTPLKTGIYTGAPEG